MVERFEELVWDDENTAHIAQHRVTPEEIEQVVFDASSQQQPTYRQRTAFYGVTADERALTEIVARWDEARGYCVTARDMSTRSALNSSGTTKRGPAMGDRKNPEVPKFSSMEEERRFWDEHDVNDFSTGPRVRNRGAKVPLTSTFAIRLDQQTVDLIREAAERRGLGPTQLVRSWILERLRLEREAGLLDESLGDAGLLRGALEAISRELVLTALMEVAPEAARRALSLLEEKAARMYKELEERGRES